MFTPSVTPSVPTPNIREKNSEETSVINVALHKPTNISSIYVQGHPDFAVDGSFASDLNYCSATAHYDMMPWYLIDFMGTFRLSYVNITNRNSFPQLMHSLAIELFTQNPSRCKTAVSQLCSNFTSGYLGVSETRAFHCVTPLVGRFLRVTKWGMKGNVYDVLQLCEVEAFATPTDNCEYPALYHKSAGTRLVVENTGNNNNGSVGVSNIMECSTKCLRNGTCLSFNYNDDDKECQLIPNPTKLDTIEDDIKWDYYGEDLC
ncbi:uncharacterized protein LOC121383753 [Gigantopelta aegis]|uniref:uncharacterized protein LOC121383753 n=1 Tax=Gigantopelta aegis TaxID=1735272 RepID=UPI001B88AD54|nr:uncharacterized protein LOC121383753 [Gigantopelta aegis]